MNLGKVEKSNTAMRRNRRSLQGVPLVGTNGRANKSDNRISSSTPFPPLERRSSGRQLTAKKNCPSSPTPTLAVVQSCLSICCFRIRRDSSGRI